MGFRGNITTGIPGNIFSDQGMLFGTFLMKNIFIDFPTHILKHIFCSIQLQNSCFFRSKLDSYMRIHHDSTDKTYENHWIFWWNHVKNIVQNRSWKIDENIFHQKCPKQHSRSLKVLPVMPVTIFPRKTMKNSCFFLLVCHCGTLYSKSVIPCARLKTALWRPAARQLQSDGSLRLITFRSSASSMFCMWWFTTAP